MNLIPKITNYIFLIILITCLFSSVSIKSELRQTRLELDSLSVQKGSLNNKYIESKIGEKVFRNTIKKTLPLRIKDGTVGYSHLVKNSHLI